MSPNFNGDAALGKLYERICPKIFACNRFQIARGNFPNWDVRLICRDDEDNEYDTTIECKADTFAKRTDQLAIEYSYKGRPSGIQATKAEYWAHFVHGTNRYFLIPTDFLKEKIEEGYWDAYVDGGDCKASKLFIISQKHFREFEGTYDESLIPPQP
jgi:hypothetical protein